MLPRFQSDSREFVQMQSVWASAIDPVLNQPLNSGILLENVNLVSGDNNINHKLGRKLIGWIVVRMQGVFVQLYDKQNTNQMPDKILVLNSSGTGVVNLLVF